MRHFLRWLAMRCGVTTTYHIASFQVFDGGYSVESGTYTVAPWIHRDNYAQLVAAVQKDSGNPKIAPTITSIARIGL